MPFTWGDPVRVKECAPKEARPGVLAAVVAITVIETAELAAAYGCELGCTVYEVEFGDGHSITLPESLLETPTSDKPD